MKADIVCILDRSGSMSSILDDAIGGFNSFLAAQQALPGEATMTIVLFDNQYDVVCQCTPIHQVRQLNRISYMPRGGTALYDAMGRTITEVGARLRDTAPWKRPDKVIIATLTDGEENCSFTYTRERLAQMIEHQRLKYSWEFVFLAANQDAIMTAKSLHISPTRTFSFVADSVGTQVAYASMSADVKNLRTGDVTANDDLLNKKVPDSGHS